MRYYLAFYSPGFADVRAEKNIATTEAMEVDEPSEEEVVEEEEEVMEDGEEEKDTSIEEPNSASTSETSECENNEQQIAETQAKGTALF